MKQIKIITLLNKLSDTNYVLILLLISDFLFLGKMLGGSVIITLAYFLILVFMLWLKLKNLTLSFVIVSIFTFQFYTPNKYYVQNIFRAEELRPFFGAYLLGYGINLENIFITLTMLTIIWSITTKKVTLKNKKMFLPIIIIPGGIYFFTSLASSLKYSPHIALSLVWLLQNLQMFFFAYIIYFIYLQNKKSLLFVETTVISTLVLQTVLSLMQFAKQSWVGLPIESARGDSVYFGAPDAVASLVRVGGTFAHSNQFALIITMLLVILIPTIFSKKKPFHIVISVLSVVSILLTQSRSGWLALTIATTLAGVIYKKEITELINFIGIKRFLLILASMIILTSIAVIPRINKSFSVGDSGSSAPLRGEMLKEAAFAFSQSPWIGYGIATNETTLLKLFPSGYIYIFPAPVHNGYAQMILESGIIGFLAFTFPFAFLVRLVINQILRRRAWGIIKNKSYVFIFIAGSASLLLYYLFQPYEGFREFAYLGIILGYGIIGLGNTNNQKHETH